MDPMMGGSGMGMPGGGMGLPETDMPQTGQTPDGADQQPSQLLALLMMLLQPSIEAAAGGMGQAPAGMGGMPGGMGGGMPSLSQSMQAQPMPPTQPLY